MSVENGDISFVALKRQSLCGAAAHLCSAYEELHGIGSDALAASVLEVLATLDEMIAALDL